MPSLRDPPRNDKMAKQVRFSASTTVQESAAATHIRTLLLEKSWFAFRLNNTLHDYNFASSAATHQVFLWIADTYAISIPKLETEHANLLAIETATAKASFKTADHYRRERFLALLSTFDITPTAKEYFQLSVIYTNTFAASLTVDPGAKSLLSYLKSIGKNICVMSEGPLDAPWWTLDRLGIRDCVDHVANTYSYWLVKKDEFWVARTGELLAKVVKHLGFAEEDVVMVRDQQSAGREVNGILDIRPCEVEKKNLDVDAMRIGSLAELEAFLRG